MTAPRARLPPPETDGPPRREQPLRWPSPPVQAERIASKVEPPLHGKLKESGTSAHRQCHTLAPARVDRRGLGGHQRHTSRAEQEVRDGRKERAPNRLSPHPLPLPNHPHRQGAGVTCHHPPRPVDECGGDGEAPPTAASGRVGAAVGWLVQVLQLEGAGQRGRRRRRRRQWAQVGGGHPPWGYGPLTRRGRGDRGQMGRQLGGRTRPAPAAEETAAAGRGGCGGWRQGRRGGWWRSWPTGPRPEPRSGWGGGHSWCTPTRARRGRGGRGKRATARPSAGAPR